MTTTAAEPLLAQGLRERLEPGQRRGASMTLDVVGALAAAPALLLDDRPSLWGVAGVLSCWLLAQRTTRRPTPFECTSQRARRTLQGAIVFGLGCWVAMVVAGPALSSAGLLAFTLAAGVTTFFARCLDAGGRSRPLRTLVLVGDGESSRSMLELNGATGGRMVAIGCCPLADLAEELGDVRPEIVLAIPSPELSGRALQRAGWLLESAGVPLLVATQLADVVASRTAVICAGTMDLVHVAPASSTWRWLKGSWERAAALGLLLVLLPLMLVVALVVRLDSPGPALFRQTRVGRGGSTFTMLKFRTMVQDAPSRLAELKAVDEADGLLFKVRSDPRVTRVGRFLRRYSVDELPQLLNVIAGDMALIGPRPALPNEVAEYAEDPRRRLVVKPGLTGLWQVSGRSDLSWDDSVRIDLDYVDNWSIGRDLTILARTVSAVVGHRGAY